MFLLKALKNFIKKGIVFDSFPFRGVTFNKLLAIPQGAKVPFFVIDDIDVSIFIDIEVADTLSKAKFMNDVSTNSNDKSVLLSPAGHWPNCIRIRYPLGSILSKSALKSIYIRNGQISSSAAFRMVGNNRRSVTAR